MYETLHKTGQLRPDDPLTRRNMAGMIGAAFRLSSNNMFFTADVMTNAGVIVPKNRVLGSADSLTDYFKVVSRATFVDYFNELLFPHFKTKYPKLTPEKAIEVDSLYHIEGYLRSTPKIGLMDNEDDLILTPEDLAFLKSVFGSRAKIYPVGGHCGNMTYRENVEYMLNFFTK